MHKRYAEDLLTLIRNRDSTLSSNLLIVLVKLTDFGFAEPVSRTNREDEQAAGLARRAQQGDYDEGRFSISRSCN